MRSWAHFCGMHSRPGSCLACSRVFRTHFSVPQRVLLVMIRMERVRRTRTKNRAPLNSDLRACDAEYTTCGVLLLALRRSFVIELYQCVARASHPPHELAAPQMLCNINAPHFPSLCFHSALFRFPATHACTLNPVSRTNSQAFSAPPDQIRRGDLAPGENRARALRSDVGQAARAQRPAPRQDPDGKF